MSRTARRWLEGQALDPGALPYLELQLSGTTLDPGDDVLIPSWADLSGKGRTAVQASTTPQPRTSIANSAFNPDSPTGGKGANFNFGENDNMTGALSLLDISRGLTFYAWIRDSQFATNNQVIWCADTSEPVLVYANSSGKIGFGDHAGNHGGATSFSAGYHNLVWVFPPPSGSGVAEVYQDGAQVLTTAWNITNIPSTGYTVGNNQPLTAPFGGILYELIAYSQAHDAATRAAVLAFGLARWGI